MKNKIILYIATSLDGFIARKNGSVDWLSPYEKSNEDFGYKKFYDSIGTIIMGDTTYKQVGNTDEFEAYYENKPIFVFSKKTKGKKNNIIFVNENVKKFVKKLKLKNNKNIWLLGGASIANQFLEYDLIDEFIITIIPVLLGTGIPLFEKKEHEKKLKLIKTKNFDMDVVQLHYKALK